MHKQKDRKKLRIGELGDDSGLLLTGLGHEVRGEWERNNRYMNFEPYWVVRVPRSTIRLGSKLVRVLAIATRRTRSDFGVRAKWVQVFQVSIFGLGFYAWTKQQEQAQASG
jgi:hypothetical protein